MRSAFGLAVVLRAFAGTVASNDELTIVAVNAGGRSVLFDDGQVAEHDRYYLPMGSIDSHSADFVRAPKRLRHSTPERVFNTSRVGTVIVYTLPIPSNAGSDGHGWTFALELLFDTSLKLKPPFGKKTFRADVKVMGVPVFEGVPLSGPRAAAVRTVWLTIDPETMTLSLPEVQALVAFDGFLDVEVTSADPDVSLVHIAGLRLERRQSEEDGGEEGEEITLLPTWLANPIAGLGIPAQAVLIYLTILSLQKAYRKGMALLHAAQEARKTAAAQTNLKLAETGKALPTADDGSVGAPSSPPVSPPWTPERAHSAPDVPALPQARKKRRPRKVLSEKELAAQRRVEA
jgi:hypothetical protein